MPVNPAMLVLAALLALALDACGEKSDRPKAEAEVETMTRPAPSHAPGSDRLAAISPSDAAPNDHFARVVAIKDTLLFADLANAQRTLDWLREHSGSAEDPTSWQPFTANLRDIASQESSQDPMLSVANVAAKLAAECGACHAAHAVDPHILLSKIDSPGEDFKNHMVGHKWALDRMWAGLATPSAALWAEGAALIADKPTHLRNLSGYEDEGDAAMEFARRTHELAGEALKADTTEKRVDLFARFLSTCASCHGLEGSGLRSRSAGARRP